MDVVGSVNGVRCIETAWNTGPDSKRDISTHRFQVDDLWKFLRFLLTLMCIEYTDDLLAALFGIISVFSFATSTNTSHPKN